MALILRNGGSQSPGRWLRDPRNNQEIYLEGCAFGREEGQKESIVQLVTRKYQLGDSPEKIAKDLLMSEEEVEEILGKTTGSQQ